MGNKSTSLTSSHCSPTDVFQPRVRRALMDAVRFRLDNFTIGGLTSPIDEGLLDRYKAALNEQGYDMRWEVSVSGGVYTLTLFVKPIADLRDPIVLPP